MPPPSPRQLLPAALRAAALALAAAAMMARQDIVGGRESGSRYDRSGGVRRGRYERGDCFGFALRPNSLHLSGETFHPRRIATLFPAGEPRTVP
eukprot:6053092-Prymnesium_polylepis.1